MLSLGLSPQTALENIAIMQPWHIVSVQCSAVQCTRSQLCSPQHIAGQHLGAQFGAQQWNTVEHNSGAQCGTVEHNSGAQCGTVEHSVIPGYTCYVTDGSLAAVSPPLKHTQGYCRGAETLVSSGVSHRQLGYILSWDCRGACRQHMGQIALEEYSA
jgi:hypothetical protein